MSPSVNNLQRPATVEETAQELKDGMKVALDDSIDRVRGLADKLERGYYQPMSRATHGFASENPVIFTFFVIFGALSLVPIACFLAFVTICISTLLGAVGIFLFVSISTLLFISTAVLFPILFFIASIAIFATSSLVGLFLLTRLYILTRENDFSPVAGLFAFVEETRTRVEASIPVSLSKVSVDMDIEIDSRKGKQVEEKQPLTYPGDQKLALVADHGSGLAMAIKRESDSDSESQNNDTSHRLVETGTVTPTYTRLTTGHLGSPEYVKEGGVLKNGSAE